MLKNLTGYTYESSGILFQCLQRQKLAVPTCGSYLNLTGHWSGITGRRNKSFVTDYEKPPNFDFVEFPERRKLKFLEKQPQPPSGQKPPRMFKRLLDIRGPETIHNKLIHKQYGIRALHGGNMHSGHIEGLRILINRNIDDSKMFARWRIDAPWKPITKKGQGHRMGGGKGSIDRYVTPIKGGRIIIEMGGHIEFQEVKYLLAIAAGKLPFKAQVISQQILDEEEEIAKLEEEQNMNIFSFEYCLKNGMLGSRKWASPYDYLWYGKYR